MGENLLSIGRFARLCRLSVKQLRHYDELGLLDPARVDEDTGYRLYRAEQAPDAVSIALLRSVDVPLPVIGEILAGADPQEALGAVKAHLEADLARRRRAVRVLERILTEGMPSGEVGLIRRRAQTVASVREIATPETIDEVTTRCAERLASALAASGTAPAGPIIGIFPLDLEAQVRVELALEAGTDLPGTSETVLPGGIFAQTTHVGPYEHLALAAHRILAWAGERGREPSGPVLEIYLNDPRDTHPEQLVTQLLIRLEDP
jgi:DNA-binding transcriptional MerR regulator